MIIKQSFYNRNTVIVAKELLGKFLIRRDGRKRMAGKIIETEAYCGEKDLACHASRGRTKRTEIMFGQPGIAYVYLIYGMYHCLNIVTEKSGYPAAVLIRAIDLPNSDGPGKLCRTLSVTREHNGIDVTKNSLLYIEDRGIVIAPSQIKKAERIGISYAGIWAKRRWRFLLRI